MTLRAALWITALPLAMFVTLFATTRLAADQLQCWMPSELLSQPSEAIVRRGAFAYVPPPRDVTLPAKTLKRTYRRAIRRFKMLSGQKLVALTFDIGEQPHEISGYQGKIFDYLRSESVRATVFLGGKWLLTHPQRTKQFIADPLFEVANHGWEHRNLRLLSGPEQQRAILRTQTAYGTLWRKLKSQSCVFGTAEKPAHSNAPSTMNLFRFPFGACREDSLKLAGDAGLYSIQWDVSSSDPWKGQTAGRMTRDVLGKVQPGSIVLFHANGRGWHTPKAIPGIVKGLRKKGYKFVTIGDFLAMDSAEPVLTKTCFDSRAGDTNRYDTLSRTLHAKYARFIAAVSSRNKPVAPTRNVTLPQRKTRVRSGEGENSNIAAPGDRAN